MKPPSKHHPLASTRSNGISVKERFAIDGQRRKDYERLAKASRYLPAPAKVEQLVKSAVRLAKKHRLPVRKCLEDEGRRLCYEVDTFKCPATCPRAMNYAKYDLFLTAAKLIEAYSSVPQTVTAIAPARGVPVGSLKDVDIDKFKANLAARLRSANAEGICAAGAFEVSLNVELDGSRQWQFHWHGVVAGATAPQLRKALSFDRTGIPPNSKLLKVVPAYNVAGFLCYAAKGGANVRVAYEHENGRQHCSKGHLTPAEVDELLRWTSSIEAGQLLTFVGMKRSHGKLVAVAKKSSKTTN